MTSPEVPCCYCELCVLARLQEVRPLTRLPHLTDLCFADPLWGECPLASLCNYQTCVG